MKHFTHYLRCFLLLSFISSFPGCSVKEELNPAKGISNTDIKGVWVNIVTSRDTLMIKDSIIFRWDELSNGYGHYYRYKIISDSIILNYSGYFKVSLPPYYRRISLNNKKDTLIIQDFHTVYPSYQGDIFIRTK